MLSKRAQILFDQKIYESLENIAQAKRLSVGELVRIAVEKMYIAKSKPKKSLTLADAAGHTFGAWKDNKAFDKNS